MSEREDKKSERSIELLRCLNGFLYLPEREFGVCWNQFSNYLTNQRTHKRVKRGRYGLANMVLQDWTKVVVQSYAELLLAEQKLSLSLSLSLSLRTF